MKKKTLKFEVKTFIIVTIIIAITLIASTATVTAILCNNNKNPAMEYFNTNVKEKGYSVQSCTVGREMDIYELTCIYYRNEKAYELNVTFNEKGNVESYGLVERNAVE
jgi:hypothetical protein